MSTSERLANLTAVVSTDEELAATTVCRLVGIPEETRWALPGPVAVAGGQHSYLAEFDAFENLHIGSGSTLIASLLNMDRATSELLHRFMVAHDDLNPPAPALYDVLTVVGALRQRAPTVAVLFPADRLGRDRELEFLRCVREMARTGCTVTTAATYGSATFRAAKRVVVVDERGVSYDGSVTMASDLRVRLLSTGSGTAALRSIESDLTAATSRTDSLDELAGIAVALIAQICGVRSTAVVLASEDARGDPAIAVAGPAHNAQEAEAAAWAIGRQQPEEQGPFHTASISFDVNPLREPGREATAWVLVGDDAEDRVALPIGDLEILATLRADVLQRKTDAQQYRAYIHNEAIGALVAGIAHDLNNSLQSILGLINLVEREVSGQERDRLHTMRAVAQDSAAFVGRILSSSRVGDVQTRVVDIHDVLRSSVDIARRGNKFDVEIDLDFAAELSTATVDEVELGSVFLNVLLNSFQAADAACRIKVMTSNEGGRLVIRFRDNGRGVSEEIRETLFEPFVSDRRHAGGVGLGLSVAKAVLTEFDGSIALEETSSRGTTMRLELPATSAPAEETAFEYKKPFGVKSATEGSVLVCDDNVNVLEVLTDMVSALGYDVISTSSPLDCIEIYRQRSEEISVVIVDQMMPDKSGDDVIVALCAIDPDVRVLWLSGYWPNKIEDTDRFDGLVSLKLAKPIDLRQLAEALAIVTS